ARDHRGTGGASVRPGRRGDAGAGRSSPLHSGLRHCRPRRRAGSGEPTKSGTWTMRSVDQLGGQTGHWSDLVGTKKGQEIHAEQRGRTPDGRTTILKIRYFNIQPNHFSWVADRSEDGRVTWAGEYGRIEATRHVATPAGQ